MVYDANDKPATTKRHFRKAEKFVVVDPDTGEKTCAIIFTNGKIFVGADVWRMSNPYDICEYPYKQISDQELATYKKEYPVSNWNIAI